MAATAFRLPPRADTCTSLTAGFPLSARKSMPARPTMFRSWAGLWLYFPVWPKPVMEQ